MRLDLKALRFVRFGPDVTPNQTSNLVAFSFKDTKKKMENQFLYWVKVVQFWIMVKGLIYMRLKMRFCEVKKFVYLRFYCVFSAAISSKAELMREDKDNKITKVLFCGPHFPASHEYTKEYLQVHPFIQVRT